MEKLRVLDLFSGIGGFSLGLERTGGFQTVAFCEIEEFPRRVLAKHWPEVPIYHDVTKLTGDILRADGISVDVITGGFPCQDISTAGHGAGIEEGTRSGLWSEIVRLIGELRPRYVIVENVANLLVGPPERPGGWFSRVLGDLAECGYDAEWHNVPAWLVGCPHGRERVWIVAYPNSDGQEGRQPETFFPGAAEACLSESQLQIRQKNYDGVRRDFQRSYAGRVLGVDDVIPDRLDRIKSLGNAVVPQIPEMIGNAILEARSPIGEVPS